MGSRQNKSTTSPKLGTPERFRRLPSLPKRHQIHSQFPSPHIHHQPKAFHTAFVITAKLIKCIVATSLFVHRWRFTGIPLASSGSSSSGSVSALACVGPVGRAGSVSGVWSAKVVLEARCSVVSVWALPLLLSAV